MESRGSANHATCLINDDLSDHLVLIIKFREVRIVANINEFLDGSITVGQLIERLHMFDEDMRVVFAYNYGDHSRTTVADVIVEVDEGLVEWSSYHDMPKIVHEVDEDGIKEQSDVLIISSSAL